MVIVMLGLAGSFQWVFLHFTKEDEKKLADLIDGVKFPRYAEKTLQVIVRLLMLMSNDITAIREALDKNGNNSKTD